MDYNNVKKVVTDYKFAELCRLYGGNLLYLLNIPNLGDRETEYTKQNELPNQLIKQLNRKER